MTTVMATNEKLTAVLPEPLHQDYTMARTGMWLFLFTEILLFGGIFLLYATYRAKFPGDFHFCAGTLDLLMGAFNTGILLTSSLTMTLAITNWQRKKRKPAMIFLWGTLGLGLIFLFNKYLEWSEKIKQGLYPDSTILESHTPGENMFYKLYYLVTGVHGLLIVIGVVIILVILISTGKKKQAHLETGSVETDLWRERQPVFLENSGLFWHLITVAWIFIFSLLYLIS